MAPTEWYAGHKVIFIKTNSEAVLYIYVLYCTVLYMCLLHAQGLKVMKSFTSFYAFSNYGIRYTACLLYELLLNLGHKIFAHLSRKFMQYITKWKMYLTFNDFMSQVRTRTVYCTVCTGTYCTGTLKV